MPNYDEQKVSITLSYTAYQTIKDDMNIFLPDATWAGFINRIVTGFKSTSRASIKAASQIERDRLIKMLYPSGGTPTTTEESILDKYIKRFSDELRIKMTSFPTDSGETKKIRLKDSNQDALILTDESEYINNGDYKNAGKYIKAILEDYALQSFSKRESIIFSKTIGIFNESIQKEKMLKLTYESASGTTSVLRLKPYKIIVDKRNGYNYCVVLTYDSNNEKYRPYPLRLYRIKEAPEPKQLAQHSHITKDEEKDIKSRIQKYGVAYIQGNEKDIIRVELTPEGEKLYNSIFHLRPKYMHHNPGTNIYEFDCSAKQIENYFFQFGKEAYISDPIEVREAFFQRYNDATKRYQQ